MNIINLTKQGASYFIQTWPDYLALPENHAHVPDDLDLTDFYAYNGFIVPHVEDVEVVINEDDVKETTLVATMISYEVDLVAWETWKAAQPEPEEPGPTIGERIVELEEALIQTDEAAISLYESMVAQEEINAA